MVLTVKMYFYSKNNTVCQISIDFLHLLYSINNGGIYSFIGIQCFINRLFYIKRDKIRQ